MIDWKVIEENLREYFAPSEDGSDVLTPDGQVQDEEGNTLDFCLTVLMPIVQRFELVPSAILSERDAQRFIQSEMTQDEYVRMLNRITDTEFDQDYPGWAALMAEIMEPVVPDRSGNEYRYLMLLEGSFEQKTESVRAYGVAKRLVKMGVFKADHMVWGRKNDQGEWIGDTNIIDAFVTECILANEYAQTIKKVLDVLDSRK